MAGAGQVSPCTTSSTEQLCPHWMRHVPPQGTLQEHPPTSQHIQVSNSVQADPAKTRSSSDRDTNNFSFVWHSFNFLVLLRSWAAAADPNTHTHTFIYRTHSCDGCLPSPPRIPVSTQINFSQSIILLSTPSPYINSSDKIVIRQSLDIDL